MGMVTYVRISRCMEMMVFSKVILASASPRRKELFALLGYEFRIHPPDMEESPFPGEIASDYVVRLAEEKAKWVSAQQSARALIIAADTTVVFQDQILGKPSSKDEAEQMLLALRGNIHQVYSGLAINLNDWMTSDLCRTDVPMRQYTDQEIQAYIDSGDPFDKAGAYAIQHTGFHPVHHLSGCFANVMGLPLCHLARSLRKAGISVPLQVPHICQEHIDYDCPVFHLYI